MKVIAIEFHFDAILLGLLEDPVHNSKIFLSVAEGRFFKKLCVPVTICFRYSILPALSLDGILHLEVLDHSFLGEEFQDFVSGILDRMQPWPLPNSVLVMDNASIHKVPGIREMVEERYVLIYST